jgi:hypothetical protein
MNASFIHVTLGPKDSAVHVQVSAIGANSTAPVTAALRPRGSPAVALSGSKASFDISDPGHYILELDGNFNVTTLSTGLMVFASLADPSPPSPDDPSVVYFGPGVHSIAEHGGVLTLENDSLVYLAPGAVVRGRIEAANVRNVTVRGTGILAAEWLPGDPLPASAADCAHCGCPGTNGVLIQNSTDILLEDFTVMHVTSWMVRLQGVSNARVRGIRELGWRCNNDGVDIVSSQGVVVEGCFIRSADDAIAVKGLDPSRDTRDIVVRDSLLFPHGNCMEVLVVQQHKQWHPFC